MSGIEKICEISGEYHGWLMYGYKRNHIQVVPGIRKAFSGQQHTLYISKKYTLCEMFGVGGYADAIDDIYPEHSAFRHNGLWFRFRTNKTDKTKEIAFKTKVSKKYDFVLHVPCVPGRVKGMYFNQTFSIGCTKRRLKRMLKCEKLNVVYVDDVYNIDTGEL